MPRGIIKSYLAVFAVFFIGYSFLNWLLTTKTRLIHIDKDYLNFWIPVFLIYVPTFIVLRPLVKESPIATKARDGILWVLLPISISIPTAFAQQYFKDLSYPVIIINSPDETILHPNQRFFEIKTYHVKRGDFTLFKDRHVKGAKNRSLKVSNYYIAPLYSDSINKKFKVACGVRYSTSINYGFLFKDKASQKTEEFNRSSQKEFSGVTFYNAEFFERQMDSEDAANFTAAWQRNPILRESGPPVVLVPNNESFSSLLAHGRNRSIWSILISLTITLGLLRMINR